MHSLDTNALYYVASKGYVDALNLLISAGADVNNPIIYGGTPLMIAANKGHIGSVIVLIDAGADTHTKNNCGNTALDLTIDNEHRDIVTLLDTPSLESDEDLELEALFAEVAAAPIAIQAQQPIQPNQAAVTEFLDAVREGNHVTIQRFIEMGLPINETDENGDSALHLAIRRGSLYIVHLLIYAGASLNVSNNAGHTPLRLALNRGNLELVFTIRAAGGRIRS